MLLLRRFEIPRLRKFASSVYVYIVTNHFAEIIEVYPAARESVLHACKVLSRAREEAHNEAKLEIYIKLDLTLDARVAYMWHIYVCVC